MAKKLQVILTLDPAAQSKGEAVVNEIKAKGLELESVMSDLGIITGKIVRSKLKGLSRIPGVTVEQDQTVSLAPPDAEVQ
jgi:hypothetical protein